MLALDSDTRRALRARAHALHAVVSISQNGLSESVLKEIDISLTAHQLIKIRVYHADRESREQFLTQLCDVLQAAPVQHIGKLLVLWRPPAEVDQAAPARRRPSKRIDRPSMDAAHHRRPVVARTIDRRKHQTR
ncbi:MAG TPA: YhbY family RNA-binding protein [Accumulibacter sp.]|nr:YhbY family RNA-binding protein [Accumulibacter sp.]HNE12778.1 YhbY family RNA-binding protein [Accumulibacter sp.]HNG38488.1 YhbY family RNA-binding protein [Accumulibacter sp.]HNH23636.1 YhbY family RNA-binding protein [Accumulibacter sp.]HNI72116.1 YhbY family RNA-binding protein [Accumulibacter sp.]